MMEMLRDIPCYKAALKAVLKGQIQFLAEQLSSEIDEETVILSASTVDGSVCQLGSRYGKNFLQDKGDIQSQFSKHCLHKKLETPTGKEKVTGMVDSEEVPNHAVTEPTAAHNNAESLSRDETTAEPDLLDQPETVSAITSANQGQDESLVAATANTKPSHSKGHGRKKRKRKLHDNSSKKAKTSFGLNESSERDENDQNDTVNQQAERYVDNVDNVICDTKLDNTGDSENEGMPFKITIVKTDVGIDDDNTVKVEPESDDSGDIDDTGDMSDGENTESIGENMASTSKGDKTPKLEVAEPTTGKKGTKLIQCPVCYKQFKRKDNLQRHSKLHLDTPPQDHCRLCNQYFSSSEALQKHNLEKHNQTHLCSTCGKTFKSKTDARRHALLQHEIQPEIPSKLTIHTCPYQDCSKRFNQKIRFIHHMNWHTGDKPYICVSCGKKFADRYRKNKHEVYCGGKASVICPHCGVSYSSKEVLEIHINSKHLLKTFPCHCGKAFSYQSALYRHKREKNH